MNWHRVRLDSVIGTIESGSRPKGGVSSDFGEVPSLGGENILNSGGVTLGGLKLVPKVFYDHMTKGHLTDGDVLINKDGAQTGKVGLYHTFDGNPACINEHIFLIRGIPDCIVQNYLYYILLSDTVQNQIRMQITGSAQPGLKSDFINAIYTDIPETTTEQLKIAEILSTVDQAIEQTGALIAKQQRIKTGLMQDLLTRGIDEHGNLRSEETHEFKDSPLGRIPVTWTVERLGNVIGPIVSGWSPTCNSIPAAAGEWGVLKTTTVVWGGYKQNETKRLPDDLQGIEAITVQQDDILITRKGPTDRVGVVVHVPENHPRLMIPDTIFRIRLVPGSEVVPAFLPYALGSVVVQSDWFQKKIGLADAQVDLNHSILRSTMFPKPTKTEQQQILEIVATMSKQLITTRRSFAKLRAMKTALMQDLLTGKVPVTPLLSEPEVAST